MQVIHKPKPDPKLMTQTELLAYVHELEAENARLEESFQKATGAVAADALPTLAEMRKVKEMCAGNSCPKCMFFKPQSDIDVSRCLVNVPCNWALGGADNG